MNLGFRGSKSHTRVSPAQMILDGKLAGTLDQGAGCLDVFEEPPMDKTYPAALCTFENMGTAINTLVARSHKIAIGGQA